jgi:hypothetical protein
MVHFQKLGIGDGERDKLKPDGELHPRLKPR